MQRQKKDHSQYVPSIHIFFKKENPKTNKETPPQTKQNPKYIHCRRLIRKNNLQFLLSSLQQIHVSAQKHVFLVQTTAFFLKACGINAKKHQNGTIWRLSFYTDFHSTQEFLGNFTCGFNVWQPFPGEWGLSSMCLVSDKYATRPGKWKIPFVSMFQYLQMEVCLRNHMGLIPGVPHNNRIQETNPNHISK